MSYIAFYYSTDPTRYMLGGVRESYSEPYSHEVDAQARLEAAISIHKTLDTPLRVEGHVFQSKKRATIVRHCETPQAVGCICPECGVKIQ